MFKERILMLMCSCKENLGLEGQRGVFAAILAKDGVEKRGVGSERQFGRRVGKGCSGRSDVIPEVGDPLTRRAALSRREEPSLRRRVPPDGTQRVTEHSTSNGSRPAKTLSLGHFSQTV